MSNRYKDRLHYAGMGQRKTPEPRLRESFDIPVRKNQPPKSNLSMFGEWLRDKIANVLQPRWVEIDQE